MCFIVCGLPDVLDDWMIARPAVFVQYPINILGYRLNLYVKREALSGRKEPPIDRVICQITYSTVFSSVSSTSVLNSSTASRCSYGPKP